MQGGRISENGSLTRLLEGNGPFAKHFVNVYLQEETDDILDAGDHAIVFIRSTLVWNNDLKFL